MDLLGSILSSMDKPPTISNRQREINKRQQEEMLNKRNAEKEMLKNFRLKTEKEIECFLNDPKRTRLKYPPMDQLFRSIVHEIAEESDVIAHSFGQDGVDRYVMVFKKEYPPSEDELYVLRRGEEWNEEKEKEMALMRARQKEEELEDAKKSKEKFVPNSNYREKYQHLIGLEAAKEAARVTQTNKQYGFVPSENKKDHRSIEETLADIQRKKRKLNHDKTKEESSGESSNSENALKS